MKNKMDLLAGSLLTVMFFAVFGAFFDVITPMEAVAVLAVLGIPLTICNKLLAV